MSDLLYKEEVFKLVGICMEIHGELGKGYDEVIYKDAYLTASKLKLGLLVNFGEDSLTWKRVIHSEPEPNGPPDLRNNSRPFAKFA